ncbi:hypothetical protein IAD21_06146 [Abditibacteriota bacterium]|nr:hypothetical protein IAD21_06146 [Abditibacteriota bacterium]
MSCFLITVDPTLAELDGPSYTTAMQHLIHHADHPPLVPLMVVVSLISPLVSLYLLRRDKSSSAFKYTLAAFALFIVVLYITIVLNVPINNAITSWKVTALPSDWAEQRSHWHALNLYRTPASALAFFAHILACLSLGRQTQK